MLYQHLLACTSLFVPTHAPGTLAAVRLRLAALRSAMRRAPAHSAAAAAAAAPQAGQARSMPAARKKPPRLPAPAAAAAAAASAVANGESTDDSGAENGGGLIARRTRGALQSRGQGAPMPACTPFPVVSVPKACSPAASQAKNAHQVVAVPAGGALASDEALARSLQAELNGRMSRREASRLSAPAPPSSLAPTTRGRVGASTRDSRAVSPDALEDEESSPYEEEDVEISSDSSSGGNEENGEAGAAPAMRKALRERPPPVRATRSRPVPEEETARGKTRAVAANKAHEQGGLKIRIKAGPAPPAKAPVAGPAAAAKRTRGAAAAADSGGAGGATRAVEGRQRLRKAA